MLVRIIFFVIFFTNIQSAWSQATLGVYSNLESYIKTDSDCSKYQEQSETALLKIIKKSSWRDNRRCLILDVYAENAMSYVKRLFDLIRHLKGLPPNLLNKWEKLTWNQVQVVSTDEKLCLGNRSHDCDVYSELVAKNYRWGKLNKRGLIILNRSQWKSLSESERYSLIFHEVLGIIGFELNSYQYSSMIDFSEECETQYIGNSGTMDCFMVAKIHDPSFVQ